MIVKHTKIADLYEADEIAWLDAMVELLRRGEHSELDYSHLRECLNDMAISERRKVENRLAVLLVHILKWDHCPNRRTRSWGLTILEQQRKLENHLESAVLRRYAEAVLQKVYKSVLKEAAYATGLSKKSFSAKCPYELDQLLEFELNRNGNGNK
jgi:hypothetical protein